MALLLGSRIIGCSAVLGGGIGLIGISESATPLSIFATSVSGTFSSTLGEDSFNAYNAMHRIALGYGQVGDLSHVAGRSYSREQLDGVN